METLRNAMRLQAEMAAGGRVTTKMGLVDSYDPNTYSCKVRLQPEDPEHPELSLTGFIPILSQSVGNGWGLFTPPIHNQLVVVTFIEGDLESGAVIGYVFNDEERAFATQQGEIHLIHQSGSKIQLFNDGSMDVYASSNVDITTPAEVRINGASAIKINSETSVQLGDLASAVSKLVKEEFLEIFNSHLHSSGGNPPQTQYRMTTDHLTSKVKGN